LNPSRAILSAASRRRRAKASGPSSIERGESVPERLEDELDGFYKIKVEGYRLVVQYVAGEAGPFYRVVFIERRAVVYEMFKQLAGLE
jgi:mRNA-degrading endonuclease RelE of RelBE toxin-antitoxin system